MADDISIGVGITGGDDIVKVAKDINTLERNVKVLAKTYDKNNLATGAYFQGLQSQIKALVKMGVSLDKAKKYVSDLAEATIDSANASKSAAAATKAEAAAVKAYAQARREATEANARFNAQAKEAATVAKANALEEERLKNKFVEGYTAMNIYSKEMNDLALARKKGLISTKEQTAAVASLNAQMKAGTGAFANAATGMQIVGKRANRTGVLAQQAGYQFGDFAVQVQSGTNPMVAFGQQATQLIGTFSMLAKTTKGIMAFSALGVLVPVITGLAAAFMRSRDSANAAEKGIKTLEEQMKSAKEATVGFKDEIERLNFGLEDAGEQALYRGIKAAADEVLLAELALKEAQTGRGDRAGTIVRDAKEELRIAKALVVTRQEELAEYIRGREELKLRNTLQEQAQMFLAEAVDEARAKAVKHLKAVEELEEKYGEATVTAFRLAGVPWEDMAARLGNVADEAGRLASNLETARSFGTLAEGEFSNVPTGLDAFGGGGDYRYDLPSTFRPPKKTKSGVGGGKTVVDINEIIEARKKQAEQERVLIGLSGEQEASQKTYFDLLKQNEKADIKLTDTELKGAADAIAAYEEQNRVFEEAVQIQEDIATSIANNFGDAFMSIVDGTKTAKEAFKDMARAIIKDLFRILVVEQMVKSVKGFFGFADGGAFSGGSQIKAYADGGVVGGPTFFPMAGGKTGLMGEAGPEAIMPLKRGANGKLGVQAEGSSGGDVNIVQNFSFAANGDDSVKKLIAQAAPQIANMTQKQIMDSRRRGGSMKAAFG